MSGKWSPEEMSVHSVIVYDPVFTIFIIHGCVLGPHRDYVVYREGLPQTGSMKLLMS